MEKKKKKKKYKKFLSLDIYFRKKDFKKYGTCLKKNGTIPFKINKLIKMTIF